MQIGRTRHAGGACLHREPPSCEAGFESASDLSMEMQIGRTRHAGGACLHREPPSCEAGFESASDLSMEK